MNIDHILAVVLGIGLVLLVILTVAWSVVLVLLLLATKRLITSLGSVADNMREFTNNPTKFAAQGIASVVRIVTSNAYGNVSKWWQQDKRNGGDHGKRQRP